MSIRVHAILPIGEAIWTPSGSLRIGDPTPGFTVASFPNKPRDIRLLLTLSGLPRGESVIEVYLRRQDGSSSSVPHATIPVTGAPYPEAVAMMSPRLAGVVFERPGIYPIEVVVGGEVIASYPLIVSHNHPENASAYPML